MLKLVDKHVLEACAARHEGSSPSSGTFIRSRISDAGYRIGVQKTRLQNECRGSCFQNVRPGKEGPSEVQELYQTISEVSIIIAI